MKQQHHLALASVASLTTCLARTHGVALFYRPSSQHCQELVAGQACLGKLIVQSVGSGQAPVSHLCCPCVLLPLLQVREELAAAEASREELTGRSADLAKRVEALEQSLDEEQRARAVAARDSADKEARLAQLEGW